MLQGQEAEEVSGSHAEAVSETEKEGATARKKDKRRKNITTRLDMDAKLQTERDNINLIRS